MTYLETTPCFIWLRRLRILFMLKKYIAALSLPVSIFTNEETNSFHFTEKRTKAFFKKNQADLFNKGKKVKMF